MKNQTDSVSIIKSTCIPFTKKWAGLSICLFYFLAMTIGIYGSLKVAVWLFRSDPDNYHSIMLWYGVKAHGLAWIKDWIFTQDNWLFSLVPFHFLGFLLFGKNPAWVILVGGWLTFVLSAVISGLVAWELKARRSAFLIPLTLLFLGLYAHSQGFVSYSTSHNVTNVFGLVSLLLLVKWVKEHKNTTLLLILILLVAGAISDPWMVAAYNLPIVLASIVLWIFPPFKTGRGECIKLILISAGSILAVKTQFFGTLNFLPNMHFQPGGREILVSNSIFLIKDLGGLLNIVPFQDSNSLIPAALSVGISATLYSIHVAVALHRNIYPEKGLFIFLVFSFFSIGGIFLAFIVNSVEGTGATGDSARFLLNCLYLAVIGLGVLTDLNWEQSSRTVKIFSASLVTLFLISGITSTFQIWKSAGFALKYDESKNLIEFLQKNNLSYGYGPYWESNANSVTALSHAKIRIRPVLFDKLNGMISGNRAESSKRWYTSEDWPPGQKEYFVFIKSDKVRGGECADTDLCIKGLSRQFGYPSRILKYNDASILVWDHPLFDNRIPKIIALDKAIHFDEVNNPPAWPGWANPEKFGTWSDGNKAIVILALSGTPKTDLELLIGGVAFLADKHPSQEIDVIVNQRWVASLKYDQQSNGKVRVVRIPQPLAMKNKGQLMIEFNFRNPISPAELNLSTDRRRLGLGLVSLELKAAK